MTITIRVGAADELPHLAAMMAATDPWLHFRYPPDECERNLRAHGHELYVAVRDVALAGFVMVNPHSTLGGVDIRYLCVDAPCRGQGVGTRLIEYVRDALFPTASVNLTVSDINSRARRLYRRLGFEQVGTLRDYNFAGEDEYVMRYHRGPKRQHLAPAAPPSPAAPR